MCCMNLLRIKASQAQMAVMAVCTVQVPDALSALRPISEKQDQKQ
jgi:hypothetical protein